MYLSPYPYLMEWLEIEQRKVRRKLEGIDLEEEYHKIQNKKSYLSRSMRELVVRVYESEQERKAGVNDKTSDN
mgnify:CR=1 FL=1